jgi:hypothetical protein
MVNYIQIYLIQEDHSNDRREKIAHTLSSNNRYNLHIPNIEYNPISVHSIDKGSTSKKSESHYEAYQIGWCLLDSKEKYPSDSTVIIKDTSLLMASEETLDNVLDYYLERQEQYHIGYLCRWEDKCHLHAMKRNISESEYYVSKTISPYGLQAFVVTPHGRDILIGQTPMKNGKYFKPEECLSMSLNRQIQNKNIDAMCVVPNLFTFDLRLARRDEDYLKVNECEPIDSSLYVQSSSINQYIVILIIIILLIFIIWATIKVSP